MQQETHSQPTPPSQESPASGACCPPTTSSRWTLRGKVILASVVLLVLLGVGATVSAFRPNLCGGMGSWMVQRFAHQIQLTTEQKAKLRDIYRQTIADRAQNQAQMKQIHQRLEQLMLQDYPSQRDLDTIVSDFFENAKRIALSKTTYVMQSHGVLTPQQRKILHTQWQKAKQKWQKRTQRCPQAQPDHIPPFLR